MKKLSLLAIFLLVSCAEDAHINRKTLEFKWFIDDIFNEHGPTLKQGFPRSGQCKKANTNNVI
jgi:hypothetical protein